MMTKIAIKYEPTEYKALWWFIGLYDRPTEIAEWIVAYCFCELCQQEMTVNCNNGNCS